MRGVHPWTAMPTEKIGSLCSVRTLEQVITMRSDVAVLITRAEGKGAAFRVREGQVEIRGLERLPQELVDELRTHKGDVLEHLSEEKRQEMDPQTSHLLAWASELAEQALVLPEPVTYVEAPKRTVSTTRVSWYAAHYLRTVSYARLQQEIGGWGHWTPEWWREREEEALGALAVLREALEQQETAKGGHDA